MGMRELIQVLLDHYSAEVKPDHEKVECAFRAMKGCCAATLLGLRPPGR